MQWGTCRDENAWEICLGRKEKDKYEGDMEGIYNMRIDDLCNLHSRNAEYEKYKGFMRTEYRV